MKDLSKLGRDLKTLIIIDNNIDHFQLQRENGIYIKPWYEDPKDKALVRLEKILSNLVKKEPDDVRVVLGQIHQKILKKYQIK